MSNDKNKNMKRMNSLLASQKILGWAMNHDNETVFETVTVEVIAEYENDEINSNEANSQIIEVPVLDIEFSPIMNHETNPLDGDK